ncbi:MAG: radical SAM protein [Candidatus Diapherotrites archaeon]|nr:radical SAM protein [Candidatus Diapherotrites archaeon]
MEICWNLVHCCPFSCKICMVNPATVNNANKDLLNSKLQKSGQCLNHKEKLEVLADIAKSFKEIKLDFSGGDPLLLKKDLEVIKLASDYFGAKNIELSVTGACITEELLDFLKDKVSEIDFTLDTLYPRLESTREAEYSKASIRAIKLTCSKNIPVTVATVLKKDNLSKENINELYKFLEENSVQNWFLLRFRPVGRGAKFKFLEPSENEYKAVLEYCLKLGKEGSVKVTLHHTFYDLMGIEKKDRACKIGNKLIILADGTVLSCGWAFNSLGRPLNDEFALGKLPEDKLKDILNSVKINSIKKYPACRVDYFLNNR